MATTTLLLMRHGKAKNRTFDLPDFERELSDAGKRSLQAALPDELVPLTVMGKRVQVWSSPAPRALQTASLLLDALDKCKVEVDDEIIIVNSLWEQDIIAFEDELQESEAEAVIAVGHNPMIEQMTERLTGARIPYATGAIAAMEVNLGQNAEGSLNTETANETRSRLLWFSQGPISQHWRTLVLLERTLRTAANNVDARLEAFFENPDDIETMHKFRVSIRTLRSLFAFVKPWQEAKQNEAISNDLKQVVAVTSRLRELDVLAEEASEADVTSGELVSFCESEAAAERARVSEALSERDMQKRLSRALKQARDVRWKKSVSETGLPARDVRARFDRMAEKLEGDLAVLDLADVEPTHDVRKSAKRVRYAAEQFSNIIGEDAIDIAKGMTAHQDNLGAVCDARVNIDLINGFQERDDIPEPVAWELTLLRAQNETFLYTTLRDQH